MNPNYEAYVKAYIKDDIFIDSEVTNEKIGDIDVRLTLMKCDSKQNNITRVHLTKGEYSYECILTDMEDWRYYPLTLNGQDLLCFRKGLYGFTLLDAVTLTEVFDYFPEKVLSGEESFIITGAITFRDLIVFDGCYWACPYNYFAFDLRKMKFLDIYSQYQVTYHDDGMNVMDDKLILNCENDADEKVILEFSYPELCALIDKYGQADF